MNTKIQVGSIIRVHGWVWLEKLEGGRDYRINKIYKSYGRTAYQITRPRGKKTIVCHLAENVDLWIRDPQGDLNYIEIVKA
jgi:hypothetical protein